MISVIDGRRMSRIVRTKRSDSVYSSHGAPTVLIRLSITFHRRLR